MDPVIDFADEKPEPKVEIEKKPILVYKPNFEPQKTKDYSTLSIHIKKKYFLYLIVAAIIIGLVLFGFALGKIL